MLDHHAVSFDDALEIVSRQLRAGAPFPVIEAWIDAQHSLSEDERAALCFVLDGIYRPSLLRRLVVFEPASALGGISCFD